MKAEDFLSWLLGWGLLFTGVGGAFVPWLGQKAVALQLTAPGLAEFVKFLPEIRTTQIQIERLYFLLPLFLAMIMIPLFAVNHRLQLPLWFRGLLCLSVIPLSLASLSPVWTPTILIAPEFRLQTVLAGIAIGLIFISPWLRKIPLKLLVLLFILGGLAAILLPWWQFSLVQDSISGVYHYPVTLSWGWWLTVGGIGISLLSSSWLIFRKDNELNR